MMRFRSHGLPASVLLAAWIAFWGPSLAGAATLNDIFGVAESLNRQAKQSQTRIDALTDETNKLINDYKVVLKEIEGLQVYNQQLDKQIASQDREMGELSSAIENVTVIERQITPLMMRMVDGLEQFVGLDLPFLLKERRDRIQNLREMMDRADVAASEKFSQILRAYQVENEYGRTMEAYTDEIAIGGTTRIVDVLKVGRIALVYQTSDGEESGRWDAAQGAWVNLPDSYTTAVRNGIRMARKQLSVDLLTLPVVAPGDAQ
jgi:hypothetical protein